MIFTQTILLLAPGAGKASTKFSIGGYYAGWMQGYYDNGQLPAEKIDFGAIDDIIHFALVPNNDGTLDDLSNSILPSNSDSLVIAAHAAGKRVLITVGGWNTGDAFRAATSPSMLAIFVSRLVNFVVVRRYDGIDVDWETLEESDSAQYVQFISLLRSSLNLLSLGSKPLLTAAVGWQPNIIAAVQQYFDYIDLMTYDFSGAWPGWVTWHNSPIYSGGFNFPSTGKPVPSADEMVNEFVSAGVQKDKIRIGIDFYGYIWKGGNIVGTGGPTAPREGWTSPPSVSPNIPYSAIMAQYYRPQYYRWDTTAYASYLAIQSSCPDSDMFISYDDIRTCEEKVEYAEKKGLAGVFIWEIGAGVSNYDSTANSQPLLTAIQRIVADSLRLPTPPPLATPSNQVYGVDVPTTLAWNSAFQAKTYRLQVSTASDFSSTVIDTSISSATSADLSALKREQTYYWRVESLDSSGASAFSPVRSFTTDGPPLLRPTLVQPTDSASLVPLTTTFVWRSVGGPATYEIQITTGPDFCGSAFDTSGVKDTSLTVHNLNHDQKYQWRVRAFPSSYNYGPSPYSSVGLFTTLEIPPAAPTLISPTNNSIKVSLTPVLRWQALQFVNGYRIQVSQKRDFSSTVLDTLTDATVYAFMRKLRQNTEYYWRVSASNKAGFGDWSGTSTFVTGNGNGLVLVDGGTPAMYFLYANYPNPFNPETKIRFDLVSASQVILQVYDITGRIVEQPLDQQLGAGTYEMSFDGSRLSSGVYFVIMHAASIDKQHPGTYERLRKMMLLR